ncbi:MAG: phytoene desaturase family protein [Pseudomonadota bacterium]|jgi:1-hydroxycarotenoid 3,4-desaturase
MHHERHHVAIVGAGMGGLAAAADLAHRGFRVSVFEKAAAPGGKMREVRVGDAAIDAGPTVFTMNWVFEGLFADAGARVEDHLELVPASVLARHAWLDGSRLDLHASVDRSCAAIREFAGDHDARAYRTFCARSATVYSSLLDTFMRRSRPSQLELIGALAQRGLAADGLWAMLRTPPWQSLWNALGSHFRDPRLRQLFARYSTYVGSSPLAAPATLMLIAYVEQSGVWLVRGGMRRIADALQSLGKSAGASYHYGTGVTQLEIKNGRCIGLHLDTGEFIGADAVVFNGDASALASGFLGSEAVRGGMAMSRSQRALSAITWCVHTPTRGFELEHHNVFFGERYPEEFASIFEDRRIKPSPTVYLCAQDRGAAAPKGDQPRRGEAERILLLVNAPADGDLDGIDDPTLQRVEREVFTLLEQSGLCFERRDGDCVVTRPQDFATLFPGTGGSLYGRANHGAFASFARPGATTAIEGLYLAGGSAHPGPGVPMATLSGRIAAHRISEDYA